MKKMKMQVTTSEKSGLCLPMDFWTDVLLRVPVKSLLIVRCVCKELRSLIDSTNFASLLKNNHQNNGLSLMEISSRGCFLRRSDTFTTTCELVPPREHGDFSPVGYANGLVLCSTIERVSSFVLWNPSIRKSIKICPPHPPCLSHCLRGELDIAQVLWQTINGLLSLKSKNST